MTKDEMCKSIEKLVEGEDFVLIVRNGNDVYNAFVYSNISYSKLVINRLSEAFKEEGNDNVH